ncbi:MAG: hypothetical protein RL757_3174 [Bacteroidota bacterium]|jgi:uncharacterized protein YggE
MKKLFILFLMFCSIASQVRAQATGNYESQYNLRSNDNYVVQQARSPVYNQPQIEGQNVFKMDIRALSNEKPTGFIAIFAVSQAGENAEETDRLFNERYQKLVKALETSGLSARNVYVDMISFVPKYEYITEKKLFSKKTYIEVPKGFLMQKNIHIRYEREAQLDQLVTAAASCEIYELVKVEYLTESPARIYSKLRTEAIKYLNEQIEQYKLAGYRLDTAYRSFAEKTWVTMPHETYKTFQAYANFSNLKVSQEAMASKTLRAEEKVSCTFYNPLSLKEYDIVLNPNVFEPVVQYSLAIKVQFILKEYKVPEREKIVREVQLVLPNGGTQLVRPLEK